MFCRVYFAARWFVSDYFPGPYPRPVNFAPGAADGQAPVHYAFSH